MDFGPAEDLVLTSTAVAPRGAIPPREADHERHRHALIFVVHVGPSRAGALGAGEAGEGEGAEKMAREEHLLARGRRGRLQSYILVADLADFSSGMPAWESTPNSEGIGITQYAGPH